MALNLRYFLYLAMPAILISCKKPYLPPVISASSSYLVVEGTVNSGTDSTIIKLSQTVNLSNAGTTNPLQKATVTVESDQNNSYALTETNNGKYVSGGLNLNSAQKYRLRIKTADNKVYLSDFVAVLNSPPIDSINFAIEGNGLNIYSNTHDPKNNTHYYRWDYQETWMIHSNYDSFFVSDGHTIVGRTNEIYTCWATDASSTIVLGSSAKLINDVIVNNPITSIASSSEKLGVEYSILVRQYALSADAFKFWTNLKKNTEQLGSIFDGEPSSINGNIHSVTNATEPVIGYLSVGGTSNQRIFIRNQQLPAWVSDKAYPNCQLDTFLYKYVSPTAPLDTINQVNKAFNFLNGADSPSNPLIPVGAIGRPGGPPIGYSGSARECVDCTLRGTNKQPIFWQY
jgi:Domain of unknown function (DUF4249)